MAWPSGGFRLQAASSARRVLREPQALLWLTSHVPNVKVELQPEESIMWFSVTASLTLALASFSLQAVVPGAPQQVPEAASSAQLEDVLVEGRRDPVATLEFVRSIASPVDDRSLAVWRDPVCVGVADMQGEAARFMVDRISDWAASLGLRVGAPGCRPNILVIASGDGDATARDLVAARRRDFRTGVTGAHLGAAALRVFQSSGRPVRWWHVSLPVRDDNGSAIRRLPGQAPVDLTGRDMRRPMDLGVNSQSVLPTRLDRPGRDDLQQVIIVMDSEALEHASFAQVTDYIAMVALAQINAEADTRGANSILNLFDPSTPPPETLTEWDKAFLGGLYGTEQNRANPNANISAVADAMSRQLSEAASVPNP
jgi:hypothetical protein